MSNLRPLIAVVDDEEPVRKALDRFLRSVGFDVEMYGGGKEFLLTLPDHRPDCAVLDLHMPEVTGFDVQERLSETTPRVPVVIITGHDSAEAQDRAVAGGAVRLSPQAGRRPGPPRIHHRRPGRGGTKVVTPSKAHAVNRLTISHDVIGPQAR